jgi:hypothetical protein
MQLSDVLKETDAIEDAIEEVEFEKRLKKLDSLPAWKKKELLEQIKKSEFGFEDICRIFRE